jgi:hypothetical protein
MVVAVLALFFTVGSFWWMNARPGRLVSFEPTTYLAQVSRTRTMFGLPLILHNSGATPVVVLAMQLRVEGHVLEWQRTRDALAAADSIVAAPFVVPARTAIRLFPDFDEFDVDDFILGRPFQAVVEVRTGRHPMWRPVLGFTLHADAIGSPEAIIAYSNQPHMIPAELRAESIRKLAELRGETPPS